MTALFSERIAHLLPNSHAFDTYVTEAKNSLKYRCYCKWMLIDMNWITLLNVKSMHACYRNYCYLEKMNPAHKGNSDVVKILTLL